MKKVIAIFSVAMLLVCMLTGCQNKTKTQETVPPTEVAVVETTAEATTEAAPTTETSKKEWLSHPDWEQGVKGALNDLINNYGGKENNNYVVFDFDNTCSIFDVEEQLAIYQLETMAFEIKPEELKDVLSTQLSDFDKDLTDLGYGKGSYNDWIYDICTAYEKLYTAYGPFTGDGLDLQQQEAIVNDDDWKEFATKMRAMYDLVYDNESADVAYPWITYWFTGMNEEQVYKLAYGSHSKYKALDTSTVEWKSPENVPSKTGVVTYKWTSGTQVSDNIIELWKALTEAGIDVWVCSASFTDVIRAGIDVWGMHDYCKGMLAMTNKLNNGIYINEYDYDTGYAWYVGQNGTWTKGNKATKAQTQGIGKVEAIQNAIMPDYNKGPIAGFMDSTGDFNFCTEFENLKLVVCFNRASRKVTDGGGLISEIAMYQKDVLKKNLMETNAAGDTLYVLQGREENGKRGLRSSNMTITYGSTSEKLYKNEDNEKQYQYIVDNGMSVKDAFNKFAIKTSADNSEIGFKYGFLSNYDGYHTK